MMRLTTLAAYESFICSLQNRFPSILRITLTVIRGGRAVAEVRGDVEFEGALRLSVREYLRFDLKPPRLLQYSYEVWRGDEKLYWYDSQPHPNDPALQSTYPHHKHIPPDIKHHRIPIPDLSFTHPNLPFLIDEIEQEILGTLTPE